MIVEHIFPSLKIRSIILHWIYITCIFKTWWIFIDFMIFHCFILFSLWMFKIYCHCIYVATLREVLSFYISVIIWVSLCHHIPCLVDLNGCSGIWCSHIKSKVVTLNYIFVLMSASHSEMLESNLWTKRGSKVLVWCFLLMIFIDSWCMYLGGVFKLRGSCFLNDDCVCFSHCAHLTFGN